jgi:hypothetical protein
MLGEKARRSDCVRTRKRGDLVAQEAIAPPTPNPEAEPSPSSRDRGGEESDAKPAGGAAARLAEAQLRLEELEAALERARDDKVLSTAHRLFDDKCMDGRIDRQTSR